MPGLGRSASSTAAGARYVRLPPRLDAQYSLAYQGPQHLTALGSGLCLATDVFGVTFGTCSSVGDIASMEGINDEENEELTASETQPFRPDGPRP